MGKTETIKDVFGSENKIHKGKATAQAKVQILVEEIGKQGVYDPHMRIGVFLDRNKCSLCNEPAKATVNVAPKEYVYMCKEHLKTFFDAVLMIL